MRYLPPAALAAALALPLPTPAAGPGRPVHDVVDHFIDARLAEEGVAAAPPADDATLVRRVTLDLVGRVPTAAEVQAFVESADPDKRAKLIDRLFASPGFVRHQAAELDALLMAGTKKSLRDYLVRSLGEGAGWDRVFRELILADESRGKGSAEFIRARVKDIDRLTTDVSRLFFGVDVSCARCHDHPLVEDWKQDHFFGMQAFFARTYEKGGTLGEKDAAVVKFRTTRGEDRQARMMFLTGKTVEPPPSPAQFSARARFAEVALEPGQREFFARSLVNRVWHRLFGHGLVTPLDQMHSENPPSHPELLDWLARDAAEHGYDLKRLLRGLMLSRAYARSSRWESAGDAPAPRLFAVARVRPLTPLQLATSLKLAAADPAKLAGKPDESEKRFEAFESAGRGFASLIAQPTEDFQIGVAEALLFSNADRFAREFLPDGPDTLVGRLKGIADPAEAARFAVRSVLGRPAAADEARALGEYLRKRDGRRAEAARQVVWALLTSPEFRFNH